MHTMVQLTRFYRNKLLFNLFIFVPVLGIVLSVVLLALISSLSVVPCFQSKLVKAFQALWNTSKATSSSDGN